MRKVTAQILPGAEFGVDMDEDLVRFQLLFELSKEDYAKLLEASKDKFKLEVGIDELE